MIKNAIGAMVGLWVCTTPAVAFCPYPTPKACSAFFESDAVFVGTVVSQRYTDEDESIRFRVRVERVLRGSVADTTSVYTGNDSGRLLWEIGEQYVVFARRERGRLWAGNDCGPLSESGTVAETLRQIKALDGKTSSIIEGEILSSLPAGPGVPDVRVRVLGGTQVIDAKSDANGRFSVEVSPGRYRIVLDPAYQHSDYNLWMNPEAIVVIAGQCAQLQFALAR